MIDEFMNSVSILGCLVKVSLAVSRIRPRCPQRCSRRVNQHQPTVWPPSTTFYLVVFAQSFHWVQPWVALKKVTTILSPDGQLALLSQRRTAAAYRRRPR